MRVPQELGGVPCPSSLRPDPVVPSASGDAVPGGAGLAEGSTTGLSLLLLQTEGQRASVSLPVQILPLSRKSIFQKKVVSLCCRAALALALARGAPSQAGEAVLLQRPFLSSFPFCEITAAASPGQLEGDPYNGSLTYCGRTWQLQTWWAPISF